MSPERLKSGIADDIRNYYLIPQSARVNPRIFQALIQINKAHIVMLEERGIISSHVALTILNVLNEIEELGPDKFKVDYAVGDLYMNMESYVIEKTGDDVGGRMHTGRSRNDLYQTALHFTLTRTLIEVLDDLLNLRRSLVTIAESHVETIMPGYTHTQHAQPITFGHYVLAVFDGLTRDFDRLSNSYDRINRNPLGAAAIAGTGFQVDRNRTADLLGFEGLLENTLDAVSEKDDVLEVLSDLAIMATTLSRLANDLVYWSSEEFGMIELADRYCTSSSIMPQKKNPWGAELLRAYSGLVIGDLMKALTILKGVPIGFNMDIWVILENVLWDAVDISVGMIRILRGILQSLKVNRDIMQTLAPRGFSTTTELVDVIVRKKQIAFRTAHRIVGLLVRGVIEKGLLSSDITEELLDKSAVEIMGSPIGLATDEIQGALNVRTNVEMRNTIGGPAPNEVRRMIAYRKDALAKNEKSLQERKDNIGLATRKLEAAMETLSKKAPV
ncbi:MAG: argininosuccinate lyase [Candidatus Bathyarchaeia archaeon]